MEVSGSGVLGRLGEKVLGWIAFALILGIGWSIYQMPGETKAVIWSGFWRAVLWVVVVAAVPWSGKFFIRRIVEIGSNWAGLAMVAGLLLADVVAAALLMTGWPAGGWAWIAALAALATAGTYNYLVAGYLSDMAE